MAKWVKKMPPQPGTTGGRIIFVFLPIEFFKVPSIFGPHPYVRPPRSLPSSSDVEVGRVF